jgi:hypothetical protein
MSHVARAKPSMAPVYLVCFLIAAAFVGAIVALGYLLR